ncbi:putative membrane protein [Anaerosolibacter carboniphilus]|uniref:Putative membrane protein n=1 Tax=Anaerosolibacter carboniphilus TaxID=1417629 RepID=A0A841KZB6_9FIRM|nr:ECF transporter S component [Anaerosolibacter carboniphilus]MBB6218964.1 putative membrane protein [Anaerosolibacter carboniphilus]
MWKMSIKKLVLSGLMAALVLVGTMLIQIPTPMKGYIHIGDSMVYLSGILLGPIAGSFAAAVGSMLADLFLGYGVYAPATFVIKGLDALVVGFIYHKIVSEQGSLVRKLIGFVVSVALGGAIMVGGYLIYETMLYGFAAAVLNVLANMTQAIGGGILAAPLLLSLDKIKIFHDLYSHN